MNPGRVATLKDGGIDSCSSARARGPSLRAKGPGLALLRFQKVWPRTRSALLPRHSCACDARYHTPQGPCPPHRSVALRVPPTPPRPPATCHRQWKSTRPSDSSRQWIGAWIHWSSVERRRQLYGRRGEEGPPYQNCTGSRASSVAKKLQLRSRGICDPGARLSHTSRACCWRWGRRRPPCPRGRRVESAEAA